MDAYEQDPAWSLEQEQLCNSLYTLVMSPDVPDCIKNMGPSSGAAAFYASCVAAMLLASLSVQLLQRTWFSMQWQCLGGSRCGRGRISTKFT